jgi:hypothetical protein
MLRLAFLCFVFAVSFTGATVDRIVITVGLDAITETQLEEEMQVTAFLNHTVLDFGTSQRRAAAHRLLQQTLIARDMELAHFPAPESSRIDRTMTRIIQDYGTSSEFVQALSLYHINQDLLKRHLALQLAALRFIEYRFRPELTISEDEMRAAYDRRKSTWRHDHPGETIPDFNSSRAELRTSLIEQRTDEALDTWLNQTTSETRVVYLDPTLEPVK